MKLVLFQVGGTGEVLPGLLTDRGVVSIADIVKKSYTPQLTMNGIIDDFDKLKPALERAAAMNVRVLGIFGPTDPRLFGPYPLTRLNNHVIQAPVGDLRLLSAKDVYARFQRIDTPARARPVFN